MTEINNWLISTIYFFNISILARFIGTYQTFGLVPCLLPVIDEHGVGWRTVGGQLSVARGGGHHSQLDGVEWVAGQQLSVEPGVDHGGLQS